MKKTFLTNFNMKLIYFSIFFLISFSLFGQTFQETAGFKNHLEPKNGFEAAIEVKYQLNAAFDEIVLRTSFVAGSARGGKRLYYLDGKMYDLVRLGIQIDYNKIKFIDADLHILIGGTSKNININYIEKKFSGAGIHLCSKLNLDREKCRKYQKLLSKVIVSLESIKVNARDYDIERKIREWLKKNNGGANNESGDNDNGIGNDIEEDNGNDGTDTTEKNNKPKRRPFDEIPDDEYLEPMDGSGRELKRESNNSDKITVGENPDAIKNTLKTPEVKLDNNKSNATTVSSKSAADLHYESTIKSTQIKNENTQVLADAIVNTGVVAGGLIVNAIDKKRLDNIRVKNDFISRELPNINKANNDLNVLFKNKNYEAFNEMDKKLRNVEATVLEYLEWVFQHNGGANFELERQIIKHQRNRSKLALKINTESLVKESKKLKNKDLLMRCHDLYISEIKELAGAVTNDKGQFLEGSDFELYEYWINFIDEERKERVRILLNLNTNYSYFNRNWETYFYLSNNYYDTKFDKMAKEAFFNSGVKDRIAFLTWVLTSWNYIDYSNKDDSHLRMILGDGSEPIYYYNVGTALSKGKPMPLYKYLNNSYYGYKNTKSNELVQSWVKKDEFKEGKKSSDLFDIHLKETTGVSSKEMKIIKARMLKVEKLMKKKSYDKALIEIKKIREIEPNNFKYIIGEANIYLKKEDFKNYIRLLKEAVKIKPLEVDLFYRIGFLEMNSGNYNEAIKNLQQATFINRNYKDAYIKLADAYNLKAREVRKLELNNKNQDRLNELKSERIKLFEGALFYYKNALKFNLGNKESVEKKILAMENAIKL